MLAPPADLDLAALTDALADGWGIDAAALDYLPVGFGSHHWCATDKHERRWFVTVDVHETGATIDTLRRAFATAIALRHEAGLRFVLAPEPAVDREPIRTLPNGRFTVAVTPWIDAAPLGDRAFASTADRERVLALLRQLHAATPLIGTAPLADDLTVPHRAHLAQALGDLKRGWSAGPFAEPARALLASDAGRVRAALDRYDELAAAVRADPAIPWVVTHGEPHQANVLRSRNGALHLIDWDTVRLGPRERDFWMVLDDDTDPAAYGAGGPPISPVALRLFGMRWDLAEIAEYIREFRAPHADDANTRESWRNLRDYLPVNGDHLA